MSSTAVESEAPDESDDADGAGDPDPAAADGGRLTTDEVFELLGNRRRRYALHHLQRTEGSMALGELAEHIAAWEHGTTVESVTPGQRRSVYTSLQQFHLPKMAEKGVVEYDEGAGTVTPTERAAALDIYLEVVRGGDIPWSQYYLGLSAVHAAVIAAVFVDAYPLTLLPDLAWGAFIVSTTAVSALIHTYSSANMRLEALDSPPER